MDIESVKRWQWAIIGLLVGWLVAGSRAFFSGDYPGHSLDHAFDAAANGAPDAPVMVGFFFGPKQWNYLSDVVIHPPVAGGPNAGTWVTGKIHELKLAKGRDANGKTKWDEASVTPFFHRADTPYLVGRVSYPNVTAYLDEVAKRTAGKGARYRIAWWEKSSAVWTIYPAAGLLLIGGLWPVLLSLMSGAGLGRKREPAGVDLSKYKSTTAPAAQAKAGMSDEDRKQLDAVTTAMEADLLDGAGSKPAQPASAEVEPPVRQLESESSSTPAEQAFQRPKAFGEGGYYPTEIHHPTDDQK